MRYDALAVADAARVQRVSVESSSLLGRRVAGGVEVLAVGRAAEIDHHPAARGAERVSLADSVLIPGLVNAHTHLDLTYIGPQPHDPGGGFMAFVERIRTGRATEPAAIAASVRRGIDLCLAGGCAAVGDIAGAAGGAPSAAPFQELVRSPLGGVSFLEFFGIGRGTDRWLASTASVLDQASANADGRVRLGLQPHAPYSVSPGSYRWAIDQARRRGLPLCTHLAETPEEHAFVSGAAGPFRAFLEELGVWDEGMRAHIGQGLGSIQHLAEVLGEARVLGVHVNQASDADIETLARSGTSVAYCPRASAYFGAERHFGPHRYRDMLSAGINVCLGTDSIINLPAASANAEAGGISVLDEMRFLYRRDGTDPATLLAMATVQGAAALGVPDDPFSLTPSTHVRSLLAVSVEGTRADLPALTRVMLSNAPPTWIAGPGAAHGVCDVGGASAAR